LFELLNDSGFELWLFFHSDDIPVQPDESGKLPTITEDETGSKTKTGKSKAAKKDKAAEKLKGKETRGGANLNNSSLSNGDTVDSIQVAVVRGQQRSNIDSIELNQFTKSKDIDSSASPYTGKHAIQTSKSNSSNMKTSVSNKDIKNGKQTSNESKTHSGATTTSETFSTDL